MIKLRKKRERSCLYMNARAQVEIGKLRDKLNRHSARQGRHKVTVPDLQARAYNLLFKEYGLRQFADEGENL